MTPQAFRAGIIGGLLGGVVIWGYEACVWAGWQHLLPLSALPANAVGLTLGKAAQIDLGAAAYVLGTAIHFGFAVLWGLGFAQVWPHLRGRDWEASLAGLLLAPALWGIMHAGIALLGQQHPNYIDPAVVIGGMMSHIFYTVPMALCVRWLMNKGVRNA